MAFPFILGVIGYGGGAKPTAQLTVTGAGPKFWTSNPSVWGGRGSVIKETLLPTVLRFAGVIGWSF